MKAEELFVASAFFFAASLALKYLVFPQESHSQVDLVSGPPIVLPDQAETRQRESLSSKMGPQWAVLLVAGDKKEHVFDNAVHALSDQLGEKGLDQSRIQILSATAQSPRHLSTHANINHYLASLTQAADGCMFYITSHGTKKGMHLAAEPRAKRNFSPKDLDASLDEYCGKKPTIVIISGCYSGVFLRGVMKAANRIILTASRADRTSFGCTNALKYTYFDEAFLEVFPRAKTWRSAFAEIKSVIAQRELAEGASPPSQPQSYFGKGISSNALIGLKISY